jgi:hypothetical protein
MDDLRSVVPAAQLLSNGRYHVVVTAAGGGYAAVGGMALTRWLPDRTRDADGVFLYVRDRDSGTWWSAAHQPVRRRPARSEVHFAPGVAEFVREDEEVATRLEVAVCPDRDLEVRRLTLTNRGGRARRLEVTTCAEPVIGPAAAHAAHPGFSKLFVQTGRLPDGRGVVAMRRPRSRGDATICLAHALVSGAGATGGALEIETDRARFLGRGRSRAAPLPVSTD